LSSWSNGARRAAGAALAALLGGWVVAALAPRDFTVGTFQDDAGYAVLAKAIREQHTYRNIDFPGHPPELKFAPGWPAVLALAWKPGASGDENLERLRWVNLALVGPLAAAIAVAGLQVFGLPAALSAVVALASVAAPAELTWWTIPMSEPLCLALLALGLVLAERGRPKSAAVALVAAVYVRSVAAPFLVALVVATAWKQGWRRAVAPALIGIVLFLPWVVHVTLNAHAVPEVLGGAGYGSYWAFYGQGLLADPVTMLFRVPWVNAPMIVRALGQALLGWHWAPRAVELLLGTVVAGLVVRAGRTRPVFWIGLALYVLTVLFWPFPQEDRFVGSVWPLLLLAALAALPWPRARWSVAAGFALAAAVAFARGEGVRRHLERSRSSLALMDSLRPRIPPGSLVATSNPPLVYLRFGNPTIVSWRERSYRWYRMGFWATAWGLGDDLWAIVRAYHPDYLIIERRGAEGRYAAGSLIRQCPGVLHQEWSTPGGEYLFAVRTDVPCAPVVVKP
jgi:hypothetical protein